jgi:MFS family permease
MAARCAPLLAFFNFTIAKTMPDNPSAPPAEAQPVHPGSFFLLCVTALATTGIGFSIRSNLASELQSSVFDPIDKLHSAEMVAGALGVVFLGYAFTIAIGSPLLDWIGMGRLLRLSSLFYFIGTMVAIFAQRLGGGLSVYRWMWLGMLIMGVGQGLVETVINPLTATLYPTEQTRRLNTLHAWWPGGIIIGGLGGLAMSRLQIHWQTQLAVVLIPAAIFGLMTFGKSFPPTQRVASGVSAKQMFKAAAQPFFILWFLCMFLTAASELAPGQWVDMALSRTVGMKGIWLLVYVSGLMFIMRHFAGPLAHKFSAVGLLWISCLLACAGLLSLSAAHSVLTGFLAATVWGVGVCYMWPTMIASASERFPRGGALIIGLMGTGGTLSIYFVLPLLGKIFDAAKIRAAGGVDAFNAATGIQLNNALSYASQYSFRAVAILPAILLFVFGAIWLFERRRVPTASANALFAKSAISQDELAK